MTLTQAREVPADPPPTRPRPGGRWRHRLADRGLDGRMLLLVPALLFVLGLFIYPFLYGLGLSFEPVDGGGPLSNYRRFFTDPYHRNTITTTLRLAVPASLVNVLASVPIAYRMRGRIRGKRSITIALVVPITLGTVLTAEGMLNFLGPAGWFNRIVLAVGVVDEPLRLINNYCGVFFSLIITGFPFAYLLVTSYLSGIDPALEHAASTLGAGRWSRFRRITLPLLVPGLATTFCLTFVLAFSVFPSAILVGDPAGTTRVISIAAYQAAYEQYDYPFASAVAMIMGAVEALVIGAVLLWRSRFYVGTTGGKG
jgi:putative spermidine/putrescine transport system permease protein